MLTSQIESYADIGGIAGPDLNLKVMLRRNVIPAYYADVGYTSWRRTAATITCIVGTKQYALPNDFWQMSTVGIDTYAPMQYIGEDPEKVMAAEANVTNSRPYGYYLTRRAGTFLFKDIKFTVPPDSAYLVRIVYYASIPFTNDTDDVELDQYIPNQYQWTLVEALKKEILFIRFGVGDPRYMAAEAAYKMWVERAMENPEMARRNKAVFSR